jgi:DHA1 family multidrug resistance protein-like MFS transporter
MRYSSDDDRTQVELPTRENNEEHLGTFPEKGTVENHPDQEQLNEKPQPLVESSGNSNLYGTTDNDSDSSNTQPDLERGDNNPEASPKAEELKKQKEEKQEDPSLVEWDGVNDPENPMNWKASKKWLITVMFGLLTFCVTFASSVFSNATEATAIEFGVSTEVTTLGTSLFVLGFSVGPLVWGPGSELFGRRLPLFFGYAAFAIFQYVFLQCISQSPNVSTCDLKFLPEQILILRFTSEFQSPWLKT